MSWRPEVKTGNDPKFYSNSLRFATKAEAAASAEDLMYRWWSVKDYRAAESDDPVTHIYVEGRAIPLPKGDLPDDQAPQDLPGA